MITTNRLETLILSGLIYNEEYARKVVPHLKQEYFSDRKENVVVSVLIDFFQKFNKPPTPEIVAIEIGNVSGISDDECGEFMMYVSEELHPTDQNLDWMISETENFCKTKAVYNAIRASIKIIEGKDANHRQDAIPSILSEALAVSFDETLGHNYMTDADARYDFYHKVEEKIPFDLDLFNKITKGGLNKKSLNVALASTGVGKSLFMCHVACSSLLQGKNVLYITMEMAEERIAERIDVNLLNMTTDQLYDADRETFTGKINKLSRKTQGTLIIKEYSPACAHAGHFRAAIEELKIKQDFTPDIIMVDYLNICSSSRMKMGGSVNSYTYIKAVAEELRGLAVENDVPILTATQTNRNGYDNSDIGLSDTSESSGIPATADLMFALISTEELAAQNQIMVKQLKNRYNDLGYYTRFVVGIDKSKMRLYDVEDSAQENISDAGNKDTKRFGKRPPNMMNQIVKMDDSNQNDYSGFNF